MGHAGSGKDTAADVIVKQTFGKKIGFAEPLKDLVGHVFGFSHKTLYGPSQYRNRVDQRYLPKERFLDKHYRKVPKHVQTRIDTRTNRIIWFSDWCNKYEIDKVSSNALQIKHGGWLDEILTQPQISARFALQHLGEWVRLHVNENFWLKIALNRAKSLQQDGYGVVVISDCRYLNEAKAIQKAGGEVWRINRNGAGLSGDVAKHSSEVEQNDPLMDELVTLDINNNGTLSDFKIKVANLANAVRNG